MNKIILIASLILILAGCTTTAKSTSASQYHGEFAWLNQANANIDSQKAISAKQFKLVAIANRGQSLPGINHEQSKMAKQKCQLIFVKGLGDSKGRKGSEQRRQWQAAYDYAKAYNQNMLSYCS